MPLFDVATNDFLDGKFRVCPWNPFDWLYRLRKDQQPDNSIEKVVWLETRKVPQTYQRSTMTGCIIFFFCPLYLSFLIYWSFLIRAGFITSFLAYFQRGFIFDFGFYYCRYRILRFLVPGSIYIDRRFRPLQYEI
jgi:hypothetical protein